MVCNNTHGNISLGSGVTTIHMETRTSSLSETNIYASPVKDLIRKKPLFIDDYTLYGDSLLLLSYPHRRYRKAELVLMNQHGTILKRRDVKKPEKLYTDPLGNTHLFTKDSTFQIFINEDSIHLLYGAAKADFQQKLKSLCDRHDANVYLKSYRYKNQVLDYFRFDLQKEQAFHFKTITREKGVNMLHRDYYWRIKQKGFTEADLRFEEMAFYKAIFAPLLSLKDSIVILNYVKDSLQIFDPDGKNICSHPLDFHHHKNWKESVFKDTKTGKVYTLFSDKGIETIKEIDLSNGKINRSYPVPNVRFIEKIKVHGDVVFFLYKDFQDQAYKKIYTMALGHTGAH
ncbi:MAG: hypothetical protein R6T91_00490 [Bacteroidales bacterium]